MVRFGFPRRPAPSSEEYEGRIELLRDALMRIIRYLRDTRQSQLLQDDLIKVLNDTR
jgi:hypothetical protein